MRLDDVVAEYLLACAVLSPRTTGWYEQKLRLFTTWCRQEGLEEVEALTPKHLRGFQAWLMDQRVCDLSGAHPYNTNPPSPYTVRGYGQVAKSFTKWTVQEGYLPSDPFKQVKRPKEPQTVIETFSAEEVQRFLKAVEGSSPQALRDRAIILFLLDTGVRATEFVSLQLNHLHADAQPAWVEVDWHTSKGWKAREVGLGVEAVKHLKRYLRLARRPHTPGELHVWLNRYGRPLTPSGVEQALIEINKRAGIDGVRVSPHTFRHTFAVNFLKATGDVMRLSRVLGHASVSVTERYLRTFRAREARGEGAWVSPADALLKM